MNNHRLLAGLLAAVLSGGGVCPARDGDAKVITLEEIFRSAETNSVSLRPSVTATAVADAEIQEALSQKLPDINANLSLSFIGDGFTTRRDLSDYQRAPIPHFGSGLGVTVTQPVYTGGAITGAIDMARLKSTAARYAADFQRDNIRFRLTGFYLDIYKYSNLRSVVEKNLERARRVLDDMKVRYEQGTVLQNDITRYELLVSGLELDLIKICNMITILNNNLTVTAGLPDGTVVEPDSTILSQAMAVHDEAWWQREAATASPTVALAGNAVDMSRTAESFVKADRYPKVGLQAGWTIDGPILVEVPPINRNLSYWWVGVNLSYNISSLYKNNRSVKRSRIATRESQERLDATTEALALDVKADYIRYREAYEELSTCLKSVELADRNYSTVLTRYTADMALITDMLDAANARLDAEQRLVNARINIIYYYYKLLFTSGTI